MFNEFVWKLYTESERGKKALVRCSSFSDALHDGTYLTLLFGLSFDEMPNDDLEADPVSVDLISTIKAFAAGTKVDNLQQATTLFENLVSSGLPFRFPNEAEETVLTGTDLTESIQGVSIGLHLAYPEHFIPYGFRTSFADLQRIGELFNLALPPVPSKKDIAGRGRYYAQLNEAYYEFRQSYGLSTVEMCAFLYDFAPRFLMEKNNELPEPSKVWPIIAGVCDEHDFQWLADATEDSLSPWNGNPNIRYGDVLLIYCIRPHNALCYLARAITEGFADPFCSYYNVVWLGEVSPIPLITFKELAAHPQLAQSSVVKTRMQGPNSGSFTLGEYDAILSMMEAKGQNTTDLPRPKVVSYLGNTELVDERNVETALVEPLLLRLGYTESDWLRQMPLRMGRGERIYPDYVFGAQTARGEERADMVLESKFTIGSEKALRETYFQAVSYAYRLRAEVVMLAAREGFWLFGQKRGSFALERFDFYDWNDLQHPDTLFKLRKSLVKPRR